MGSQLELTQVRQEIERRIAEKDEEFLSTKKNFTKGIDGMQTALEAEAKGKAEALRMKKKLEADVSELETALEHANAANAETQKAIKKYHAGIRDAQAKLEGEQRAKEVTRDGLLAAERKANSTQNALEEARTLLEQSDRARRVTEQELSDTNEQLSELTCQNQAIAGAKRKLESEMQTLHGDLDEMVGEAKISEGKATKAAVDAARLAEELRAEQDVAGGFERERKLLECQVKDCQTRLDDAEANALKGGKKAMNKMETRIRDSNLKSMLNNAEWVMPPRISASPKDASRRCPMLMMTGRIKTACLHLSVTCKTRSSHTRNRLRKLKRLLLSTWPSSAMPKHKLSILLRLLISMKRLFPRPRLRLVEHLLVCKFSVISSHMTSFSSKIKSVA